MTEEPRISVIMGVYNGERFLREAIDSVLTQSYREFEFLICDDCSTDATPEILREYEQKDPRIKVVRNQKNLGLAASLNCCIQAAQGEYLARMDSDDRSDAERLRVQLDYMEKHPDVAVVGTGVYYMDDSGQVYAQKTRKRETLLTLKDAVKSCPLIHPTVMMRTESIKAVGGYTVNALTTRAEDYDLWCKLCQSGEKLAVLPELLFFYREDSNNIAKRKYKYRIQEAWLKFRWIKRTHMPVPYFRYAIKPLLVGMLPLGIYRRLHRRHIQGQ